MLIWCLSTSVGIYHSIIEAHSRRVNTYHTHIPYYCFHTAHIAAAGWSSCLAWCNLMLCLITVDLYETHQRLTVVVVDVVVALICTYKEYYSLLDSNGPYIYDLRSVGGFQTWPPLWCIGGGSSRPCSGCMTGE